MKRAVRMAALAVIFCCGLLFSSFSYPLESYQVTYDNEFTRAPAAAVCKRTISGRDLGVGDLKTPMCVRTGADGGLIVADSGNNRVLRLDAALQVRQVIASFDHQGKKDALKNPQGVFETASGLLYIADTDNHRILEFDSKGRLVRQLPAPTSDKLGQHFVYQPVNLAVDANGRLYVIAKNMNQGLMELDKDGSFMGFIGANRVNVSPLLLLLKRFSTQEQLARMVQTVPTEYNAITIDEKGFLYTTTGSVEDSAIESAIRSRSKDERCAPVRKLNANGEDVLLREGAFMPVGDTTYITQPGFSLPLTGPSRMQDIGVDGTGNYTVLDSKRGHVFRYDARGNLLFTFGGLTETWGGLVNPISLTVAGDRVYLLDLGRQCMVEYEITAYGKLIEQATKAYAAGAFDKAGSLWNQVLARNGNCELAYCGLGQVAYRKGNYRTAADYFMQGRDTAAYSKAYSKYRGQVLAQNFNGIMITAGVLLLALAGIFLIRKLRRRYRTLMAELIASSPAEATGRFAGRDQNTGQRGR